MDINKKPLRMTWLSNASWACTGYGNQTRLFMPRIKALGYDLAMIAFYGLEGRILNIGDIQVYPRGSHPYGNDVMTAHTRHFGAEICLSLIDAWVIEPQMFHSGVRWIPWFPVDMEPLPPPVRNKVASAWRRIVFSRFGERMVQDAGLDCYYVPHGIETDVFKPIDRIQAREYLRLPNDKFIAGMVAANKGNPSRKSYVENIGAFAELKKKHSDVLLYLHTTTGERGEFQGINLPEYVEHLGLKHGTMGMCDPNEVDVLFCDQYFMSIGYDDKYMNALYNALDVHLLVSMGEGFGIPIVEAQSAGCPVIVGDWTSMSELCFSGWKVKKSEAYPFWTPLGSWQWIGKIDVIADRLEAAYRMAGNTEYRKQARRGALAYDADRVTEKYWKPVLAEIEQDLGLWQAKKEPTCKHEWIKVGVTDAEGSTSTPCKLCGAEMRYWNNGRRDIIPGGFKNEHGLKFVEPDGLEWIILRETDRDYKASNLNLTKDSVVVDIGAHVGIVSMVIAKTFGCQVYAYEPSPDNYRRLVANIEANGLAQNIHAYNMAVTGDGRDVIISASPDNTGGCNIYSETGHSVESVTLEDIYNLVGGHIDLLKIDCEGAEFEVLQHTEDLERIGAIRGEFHGPEALSLLKLVAECVPDTHVSILGAAR
jgi:FkbM family methyltransferase